MLKYIVTCNVVRCGLAFHILHQFFGSATLFVFFWSVTLFFDPLESGSLGAPKLALVVDPAGVEQRTTTFQGILFPPGKLKTEL